MQSSNVRGSTTPGSISVAVEIEAPLYGQTTSLAPALLSPQRISVLGTSISQQCLGIILSEQITRTQKKQVKHFMVKGQALPLSLCQGDVLVQAWYGQRSLHKLTDSETLWSRRLWPKLLLQCQTPPDSPEKPLERSREQMSTAPIQESIKNSCRALSNLNTWPASVTQLLKLPTHC